MIVLLIEPKKTRCGILGLVKKRFFYRLYIHFNFIFVIFKIF